LGEKKSEGLNTLPDGVSYPCYAWCGEHARVGNVFDSGLEKMLLSSQYTKFVACTVDTVAKCRDCACRYLCGGACRAWNNPNEQDMNAAPVQCDHLKQRAQRLINAAEDYILKDNKM
jgi:uncharacterized protein